MILVTKKEDVSCWFM